MHGDDIKTSYVPVGWDIVGVTCPVFSYTEFITIEMSYVIMLVSSVEIYCALLSCDSFCILCKLYHTKGEFLRNSIEA